MLLIDRVFRLGFLFVVYCNIIYRQRKLKKVGGVEHISTVSFAKVNIYKTRIKIHQNTFFGHHFLS